MTKNNLVQIVGGVRAYEKDGVAYLHIEDVARGLGFTEQKDGMEYVRWRTVDTHLSNLAFATSCENGNPHDYYIPENIFYRLCMKARNEVAEAFQAKVADEIIPSIRKHGVYATEDFIQKSIEDPDWAISMLLQVKHEREQRALASMLIDAIGDRDGKEPLFVSKSHRNLGGAWSVKSIENRIRAAIEAAGLKTDRISPHSLRHTNVNELLRAGVSIENVAAYEDHKSTATTMIYAHKVHELETQAAALEMVEAHRAKQAAGRRGRPKGSLNKKSKKSRKASK